MLKFVRLGAVVALMAASTVCANDTASMREEIADLRAKVASLETAEMAPSATGEAASLRGMKRGSITIGGAAEMPIFVMETDENVAADHGEDDEITNTYAVPEMCLKLNVQASPDMALKVKLDLEDTVGNGDLLEEMYFNWKNVGGSPITLNIGKKEVPFGQDNSIGYHEPFVHGGVDGFDGTYFTDNDYDNDGNNGDTSNVHAEQPMSTLPGEIDNRAMVEAIWSYQQLLTLSGAVFQNTATMSDDGADDTMGFQSYAIKAELTPIEGLTLQASFVNQHDDSHEDVTRNNEVNGTDFLDDIEDDSQALSLAVDYKFKSVPVELWFEYMHGWNQVYTAPVQGGELDGRFNDEVDTDTFSLGMIWGVTENIDLGAIVEYANADVDNLDLDTTGNGVDDTAQWTDVDYWQAGASVYYNFDNGMYMGLEYYHVWMDADLDEGTIANVDDNLDADADIFGFVMGYSF